MARKTVQEKIANIKISQYYTLSFQDADEIYRQFYKEPFDLILMAFQYGYLQGSKATKKELEGVKV